MKNISEFTLWFFKLARHFCKSFTSGTRVKEGKKRAHLLSEDVFFRFYTIIKIQFPNYNSLMLGFSFSLMY